VEKTEELLFPDDHPYHHSVIGSMTDLSNASVADVRNFFSTYYAPNNAVLLVAGDIDVPQAQSMVHKYFTPIPRGPAIPPLARMTVPATVGPGPVVGCARSECVCGARRSVRRQSSRPVRSSSA